MHCFCETYALNTKRSQCNANYTITLASECETFAKVRITFAYYQVIFANERKTLANKFETVRILPSSLVKKKTAKLSQINANNSQLKP